jgi:hypothetical protein
MQKCLNPTTSLVELDYPTQGYLTFAGVSRTSKVEIVLIGVATYTIVKR